MQFYTLRGRWDEAKFENWLRHNYVSVCDKTFWTKPKTTNPSFPGSNLFSLKTHCIGENDSTFHSINVCLSLLSVLKQVVWKPTIARRRPPSAAWPASCRPRPARSTLSASPSPPSARSASPGFEQMWPVQQNICGKGYIQHYQDLMSIAHGGEPVSDHQDGAPLHDPLQRLRDNLNF